MAAAIMVSTFGTINALTLTGARVYYAMARQRLFFRFAGKLNAANVPASSLSVARLWAALLVLPRTYDPATHTLGKPVQQSARVCDFRGVDFLCAHRGGSLPAANHPA